MFITFDLIVSFLGVCPKEISGLVMFAYVQEVWGGVQWAEGEGSGPTTLSLSLLHKPSGSRPLHISIIWEIEILLMSRQDGD